MITPNTSIQRLFKQNNNLEGAIFNIIQLLFKNDFYDVQFEGLINTNHNVLQDWMSL